jgi:hypothetical protein
MDDTLEKAPRELKQYRSILDMLKGNTSDEDLKVLKGRWLDPLQDRVKELSLVNDHAN